MPQEKPNSSNQPTDRESRVSPARAFALEADHLPPLKTLSIIAFALLIASTPLFAFTEGAGQYLREYLGLIWHLSMFFFICKLPAPEWGKRAGTYWVVLDVLSGLLYLNNFYGICGDMGLGIAAVSLSLPNAVRYAAHIFEGLWLISSAATTRNVTIKVCGVAAGALIAAYSFACPFAPEWMLMLNVPFMLVWFYQIVRGRY